MILNMLKSKIHKAVVTEAKLNYVGSITIDKTLMKKSGILPGERVLVVNNNNGARLETYVIEGEANSGIICLNGAAARHVQPGDVVIIMAYCWIEESAAKNMKPKLVFVDEKNRIINISNVEVHGDSK